jgi:hypothetical protein
MRRHVVRFSRVDQVVGQVAGNLSTRLIPVPVPVHVFMLSVVEVLLSWRAAQALPVPHMTPFFKTASRYAAIYPYAVSHQVDMLSFLKPYDVRQCQHN